MLETTGCTGVLPPSAVALTERGAPSDGPGRRTGAPTLQTGDAEDGTLWPASTCRPFGCSSGRTSSTMQQMPAGDFAAV